MKRVRTEQIQMAVSCYLKRRQYVDSDGPLKQGLRLSQTAEEMAANLTGNMGGLLGGQAGAELRQRSVGSYLPSSSGETCTTWWCRPSEMLSFLQSHFWKTPVVTYPALEFSAFLCI